MDFPGWCPGKKGGGNFTQEMLFLSLLPSMMCQIGFQEDLSGYKYPEYAIL
jgi:hypothetical protein